MTNRAKYYALFAFGIAVVFMAGCFPESSIEWSADGSIGLFSVGGPLYLIDGYSGELTKLETNDVAPLPCISEDGQTLVYSEEATVENLDEGLKLLPAGQAAAIKKDAKDLKNRFGDPQSFDGNFGSLFVDDIEEPYRNWVVRYLCEKDTEFAKKLKKEHLQKALESDLTCFHLKIAPRDEIHNSRTITTSAMCLWHPKLSPDGKYIAYFVVKSGKEPIFELVAAEVDGDIQAMQVAKRVSLGYDWRSDSKALLYCSSEDDEEIIGTIQERVVVGSEGGLAAKKPTEFGGEIAADSTCANEEKFLVGVLFNQLMKAEYGIGGRVFFSGATVNIPTTDLEEPRFSLFCFDPLTRTVSRVLPSALSDSVGESLSLFSLSPDGEKVLLPMEKNRFAIYSFGATSAKIPVSEEDQWGDDMPIIPPSWKGNNEITAMISSKSSFVTKGEVEQAEGDDEQLAVFSSEGEFIKVLSENWPKDEEQ